MEKRYYNASTLARVLLDLERHYGLSSAEFYERYVAGEDDLNMPGFTKHIWASFFREYERMSGDSLAEPEFFTFAR
jgi:hypothetical protein